MIKKILKRLKNNPEHVKKMKTQLGVEDETNTNNGLNFSFDPQTKVLEITAYSGKTLVVLMTEVSGYVIDNPLIKIFMKGGMVLNPPAEVLMNFHTFTELLKFFREIFDFSHLDQKQI